VFFANTSTTIPVRVLVVPQDVDSLPTLPTATDDAFNEAKYCKSSFLSVQGGGHDTMEITNYADLSELTGIFPLTEMSTSLSGFTGSVNSATGTSDPIDAWNWVVSCQSLSGGNMALNAI
jgi:hypothetical protein